MAVVNTKSTAITNADATPVVLSNRALNRGPLFRATAALSVAAGDDDGSTLRFVRIPSNAIVSAVRVSCTAITGGTAYEVGIYQTAANGGAVVDADVFASAITLASALTKSEVRFEAATASVLNVNQRLWELLGLTADPNREYDVVLTGTTIGTAAGDIAIEVDYTC